MVVMDLCISRILVVPRILMDRPHGMKQLLAQYRRNPSVARQSAQASKPVQVPEPLERVLAQAARLALDVVELLPRGPDPLGPLLLPPPLLAHGRQRYGVAPAEEARQRHRLVLEAAEGEALLDAHDRERREVVEEGVPVRVDQLAHLVVVDGPPVGPLVPEGERRPVPRRVYDLVHVAGPQGRPVLELDRPVRVVLGYDGLPLHPGLWLVALEGALVSAGAVYRQVCRLGQLVEDVRARR